MAGFDAIAEAFVRLRPKTDDNFEAEAGGQIKDAVGRIAGDAARVFAAAKIFNIGRQGLDELKDAEAVAAQTTATIKATGGAANLTGEQIGALANKLSDLSGKDDELVQRGENLLLTFRNVKDEVGAGNDVFSRATEAALDLSVSGFGSMESASIQLGKALNDPIAGMTALQRSGITFSDSQKATIASLVQTGQLLEAQKIILDEVEHQVGGAAAAYGDTLPGKLERAQTAMDNAKGAMVGGLAPALELGADLAVDFANAFQRQPEILQQVEGGLFLVGGGIASLLRPASDLVELLQAIQARRAASAATEAAAAAAEAEAAAAEAIHLTTTEALTAAELAAEAARVQAIVSNEARTFSEAEVAAALEARTAAEVQALISNAALIASDEAAAVAAEAEAAAQAEAAVGLGAFATGVGIVGVALVAATALYQAYNDEVEISGKVSEYAAASTDDLLGAYRTIQSAFGGAGRETFIDKLAQGGEQGVGALKRLRDEVARTGGDTTQLDSALSRAKTSFDNTKASTDAYKTAVADAGLTEERMKQLSDDLSERLKHQQDVLNDLKAGYDAATTAQYGLIDAQLGAQGSDIARRDAIDKVAQAEQALAEAQAGTAADTQKIRDAQLAAAQAQQDYNEAVKAGDTLKAEEAQNRIAKAQQAERDAQGSGPDPAKVAQAERDLERAKLDVERAVAAEAKAQAEANATSKEAAGHHETAAEKAKDYKDRLNELSQTGIPDVDTALQGLIGNLEQASKDYESELDYELRINGYALSGAEVKALLDVGLGISVNELNKEAQKQSGDYQTRGAYAAGGFAPAGMTFDRGEEGWEFAVLGQGVSKLNKDAFILDHQSSMDFANRLGSSERGSSSTFVQHITINNHEVTGGQRTAREIVNSLRTEAFLTAVG